MAILAAHADPEREAAGSEPVDVGELASHEYGVTQGEEVHAAVDRHCRVEHGHRGRLYKPVEPNAGETHVISAADMIDTGVASARQECPGHLRALCQQVEGREHADPYRRRRAASRVRCGRRRAAFCLITHVVTSFARYGHARRSAVRGAFAGGLLKRGRPEA
jgi:hypothetical protein